MKATALASQHPLEKSLPPWATLLRPSRDPERVSRSLTIEAREQLNEMLRQIPLDSRPTAEYQALLEETAKDDESHEGEDDGPDDPTA